jgi:hypothetical protein
MIGCGLECTKQEPATMWLGEQQSCRALKVQPHLSLCFPHHNIYHPTKYHLIPFIVSKNRSEFLGHSLCAIDKK